MRMNRQLLNLPFLAFAAFSCAHVPKSSSVDCGAPVAGADLVLGPGKVVLLGEMHGTQEMPQVAGDLACMAARTGPVMVGLEIADHPSFAAFLASDGSASARQTLLSAPFWTASFQDGRTSEAMFGLVDRIRRLKQQGLDIQLVLFDGNETKDKTRDQVMADNVNAARAAHSQAVFVLLMGDLHALKTRGRSWVKGDSYAWTAGLLSFPSISLRMSHQDGTAWACMGNSDADCKPTYISGRALPNAPRGIVLEPQPGYDGRIDVMTSTASPPAAFPEQAVGFEGKLKEIMNSPRGTAALAMAEYDRGEFAKCSEILGRIPAPTVGILYNHACCLAKAGKADDAFVKLKAALEKGADAAELAADEDLASLRSDPRWGALVK
jgi:hypothetical protein